MLQKKKKSKSGKQVEMVAEPDDVGAATAKDTIEQPPEEPEDSTPRTFESLGLSQALCSTVKQLDWKNPTDIQVQAIPIVLEVSHSTQHLQSYATSSKRVSYERSSNPVRLSLQLKRHGA